MVAGKEIVLGTKTPLGDAAVTVPAGTAFTNCEIVGEKVVVRQGPFSANISLAELQTEAAAGATPTPTPSPTPAASQAPEQTPAPTPAAAQNQPAIASAASPSPAQPEPAYSLPDWVVPAVGGALVAYSIFATLALLRSRRRPRRPSPAPAKGEPDNMPVVTLPSKPTAKPAMVADGGRAIACPLCGKSIPMDKVGKGRNRCPSCREAFVVEQPV